MKILVLCHSCGNDSSTTGKPADCIDCLKKDRLELAMLVALPLYVQVDSTPAVLKAIELRNRVLKEAGLL